MFKKISTVAIAGFLACFLLQEGLQAWDFSPPCWEARAVCDECDRSWFGAEYLYWKIKDSPEPVPLIVEVLGPSSEVVLGGKKIKNDWKSGGSFTLGFWFDDCKRLGGEVNYLFLANNSRTHTVSSDALPGSPFLLLPYFNVLTGLESTTGVAIPGVFSGIAKLKLNNSMQSAELNVVTSLPYDCSWNFGLLAGFRFWNFNEQLTFATDSPFIPPRVVDVFKTKDSFHAQNNFYGGQIGGQIDYNCNAFFCSLKAKLALGAMYHKVTIKGKLLTNDYNGFGPVEEFFGGYFALPSNIGNHKNDTFAVIPEVNLNLGYKITDELTIKLGYSFLFVNNVLWAGNEIDRNLNPSQSAAISDAPAPIFVGEERPRALMKTSNFWAQGLNVGLEFHF